MKKVLCLVLGLIMLVANCTVGFCEDGEPVGFEATFSNIWEMQAKEWFSSEEKRALLTVMLGFDLFQALEKEAFDPAYAFSEKTYVGKDGINLLVYFHGEENDWMIVYQPVKGEAAYTYMETSTDMFVEFAFETICPDGYYENDQETILLVTNELKNVLSDVDE